MKNYWIIITAAVLLVIGFLVCAMHGNYLHVGQYTLHYFASGNYAMGVFSAGIFSIGIFSIGIFSIGVFSISIFNIALYAIGIFVIAPKWQMPQKFVNYIKHTSALKLLVIGIFITIASFKASAQESNGFRLVGGFGGPIVNVSEISSKPTLAIGGGGAGVFSNGLILGGFGIETSDWVNVNSSIADYKLKTEYGGLWLGYLKNIGKGFSLISTLKTGFGIAKLQNDKLQQTYYDELIVFTPEIAVSKRLNGFSALQIGVFYNQFTGINFQGFSNSHFSSVGMSLMIRFGGGMF